YALTEVNPFPLLAPTVGRGTIVLAGDSTSLHVRRRRALRRSSPRKKDDRGDSGDHPSGQTDLSAGQESVPKGSRPVFVRWVQPTDVQGLASVGYTHLHPETKKPKAQRPSVRQAARCRQ